MRQHRIARRRIVGTDILRLIDIEPDEIDRTADRGHVAFGHLGRGGARRLEVAVDVLALHHRAEEHRILVARRAARGLDMLGGLDRRHREDGILGKPDPRAGTRVRADRLHPQPVREHAVVAHLVGLGIGQLEPRRVDADLVAQVGEAADLVGGHEMADAVGQFTRHESRVIRERLRGVARLPAAGQRLGQVPVEQRDIGLDMILEQIVDHAIVMVDALLVGLPPALREDARPGGRQAIGADPQPLSSLVSSANRW